MKCRICGSGKVTKAGNVEFYTGFAMPILDCGDCGCRFTLHDQSVYERLYAETNSCYSRYIGHAERCKMLFDQGDLAGLRAELSQAAKYRLIIEEIDCKPPDARLLEIGCSRGHLTSYFILAGRTITAVDVSEIAIKAASEAFGHHFVHTEDAAIEAGAPYDVIYHVGTIGCVEDPIGMTRRLLGLLRPGGRLLFNVPSRESCYLRDQLWIDSAPPPDLVTMFPSGFWRRHLSDSAEVYEEVEFCPPYRAILIGLQKLARSRWRKPAPIPLSESERLPIPALAVADSLWGSLSKVLWRIREMPALVSIAPLYPAEFGMFIRMTKKDLGHAKPMVSVRRDGLAVAAL
jgi:SAM-dependent methyltransferase